VEGIEMIVERPDGEKRNVMPHPKPLYNREGILIGAINMLLDLTEQRQAQQVLRDSEQRFKVVAENARVLIWMAGTDKKRTYLNKYWVDFTGRTLQQEFGDGWIENIHPDDVQLYLDGYHKELRGDQGFQLDYRLRRHDGEYRWIRAHG